MNCTPSSFCCSVSIREHRKRGGVICFRDYRIEENFINHCTHFSLEAITLPKL